MTVFQKAWNLLKIGYIPSENPEDRERREMLEGLSLGNISELAKELFLGTIIPFLEVGQEDYVLGELRKEGYVGTFGRGSETSLMTHVEEGRKMAIAEVRAKLG